MTDAVDAPRLKATHRAYARVVAPAEDALEAARAAHAAELVRIRATLPLGTEEREAAAESADDAAWQAARNATAALVPDRPSARGGAPEPGEAGSGQAVWTAVFCDPNGSTRVVTITTDLD